MAWTYSVVRQAAGGALVIVYRQGGWTSESAIEWARLRAPREEPAGTTVTVFRARGTTGRARLYAHRSYLIEAGPAGVQTARRTDR